MQDERVRIENPVGGDVVGGDKITVGNISDSYTAIGAGAQVIVNQIQQALSAVDELDKSIQAAERRLAEAIQKKLADITKPTADFVQERGNPYKALLDYKLEDAPFFYGRADAIAAMREKLGQSKLTILHSDSGSGKSSLLQSGLASRLLADGHFPLHLRPYDQRPEQFIKKAFLPDYAMQEDLVRFSDEAMTLKGFLERVTFYLGERRLIILLDQFEEFFTELTLEQQTAFAQQLRECVESDLPVWWVLVLRKEYFSDLRIFSALKPFENEYYLPTFRLDEGHEVIVEPAALKDVAYEVGLADQILDDIRHKSAEIPPSQVQLVCYTLFDELIRNSESTDITFDLYNQPRGRGAGAPGAEGILNSHLGRVLDRELKGKERKVASRILEELVTSDVRRVMCSEEELMSALDPEQAAMLTHVLAVLYDNRLVRRELDEDDQPVYELAHDYLLNEIELDPETQARKAAQELLNQEVYAYKQHGTLLSEEKFAIINNQNEYLQIDDLAAELITRSEETIEARHQQELKQAQKLAVEQQKRAEEEERRSALFRRALVIGTILGLFQEEREHKPTTEQNTASSFGSKLLTVFNRWSATPDEATRPEQRTYNMLSVGQPPSLILHASALVIFYYLGVPALAIVNVFSVILWVGSIIFLRKHKLNLAFFLVIFEVTVHAVLVVYFVGWGFGAQYYLLPLMVGAAIVHWKIQTRLSLAVFSAVLFLGLYYYALGNQPQASVDPFLLNIVNIFVALPALLLPVVIVLYPVTLADRAEAQLAEAHEKSETLLHNVLPEVIVARLRNGQETSIDAQKATSVVTAENIAIVSVLFADVVGFNSPAERTSLHDMGHIQNEVLDYFDTLAEKYAVEKIRTINDGYMAFAGTPVARNDHAQALVSMALEMQSFMEHSLTTVDIPLEAKIGINTGPVVQGIAGTAKQHYDLWRDLINTASRLEYLGQPGEIQIARPTYELVKDDFHCEKRGSLEIKGKGRTDVWFVTGATT